MGQYESQDSSRLENETELMMREIVVSSAVQGLNKAGVSIICYLPDSHLKKLFVCMI